MMLERIDATLEGKLFSQVTVNMCGKDTNKIAAKIMQNAATQGLQGPTISPIFGDSSEKWFTVTLTLRTRDLIPAVNYLRSIGGTHIVTSPVHYIYRQESSTYNSLLEKLELS